MKQTNKKTDQKKLRIILSVVVVFLWVIIFVRVYKTFFSSPKTNYKEVHTLSNKSEIKIISDTFSIRLNYIDPFFKRTLQENVKKQAKPTNQPLMKAPVQNRKIVSADCVWEDIKFGGMIKNNTDNKNIALLRIKGMSFRVSENEIIKEYFIKRIYNDSIIIRKDKCLKTFYKAI